MPTYEYRCPTCEQKYDAFRPIADRDDVPLCPTCGGFTRRIIGQVNFARSSVQHEARFSHVTGQVVRNGKDLERQITRMNEEQGTHYVLADPTDASAFGVTEEGMDATNRANTDSGKREKTLWL